MASKLIDKYQLFIMEGNAQKAYIGCFYQGAFQGYIDFWEAGNVPASSITSNGSYRLAYPIERLDSIVSTLREESPLYIHIIKTGAITKAIVATTQEAVGEEEGN